MADISRWDEFDYIVVNDDFQEAVADLAGILKLKPDLSRTQGNKVRELAELLLS